MYKDFIKKILRKFNYLVLRNSNTGVSFLNDLEKLTAYDPINTIFDVGGNFGQTALQFFYSFPSAHIYTFEPVLSNFKILKKNLCGKKRISAYNLALGERSGTVKIGLTKQPGRCSILLAEKCGKTAKVNIDTMDNFTAEKNIDDVGLLKIDVEGYDLQVLKGSQELLKRGAVRYIYVECGFLKNALYPQQHFFKFYDFLLKYGFCFVCF
jgi:FkbM family methyltransferase